MHNTLLQYIKFIEEQIIIKKPEIKKAQDVVGRQEMRLDRTTSWWRHMVLSSEGVFCGRGVFEWGQFSIVFWNKDSFLPFLKTCLQMVDQSHPHIH